MPLTIMVTGTGSTLGEAVYNVYCITCHGGKGSGSLIASDALKDAVKVMQDTMLIEIISQGLPGTSMPGYDRSKRRWYNNGKEETLCSICPEGWKPGRLK